MTGEENEETAGLRSVEEGRREENEETAGLRSVEEGQREENEETAGLRSFLQATVTATEVEPMS